MNSHQRLKKHLPLLQVLKGCSPEQRDYLLSVIPNEGVNVLSECLLNTVSPENISLKPDHRKQLKEHLLPHKNQIRKAMCCKSSVIKRRRAMQQTGGYIPSILTHALPAIGHILTAQKSNGKKDHDVDDDDDATLDNISAKVAKKKKKQTKRKENK